MPLWDYVILEKPEDEKSLIQRPENVSAIKMGTLELRVLYCGPDCKNIKPGDRLVFNPQAAISVGFEGKQYFLVSERSTGIIVAPLRKILKAEGDLPKI